MTADPLSREAALQRVHEAGKRSGLFGSPKEFNPYLNKSSFRQEEAAWEAGRIEGVATRKAGKA